VPPSLQSALLAAFNMTESPQRYLSPDQRDFVAVYARR
jgi:hypothetical protein